MRIRYESISEHRHIKVSQHKLVFADYGITAQVIFAY